MATIYVDAAGLHVATLEEILNDIVASQRSTIAPDFDQDPDAIVGNLNAIVASHLREVVEIAQVAYNAFDEQNADNDRLGALGMLTGTKWREATKGQLKGSRRAILTLTNGTTVPAGSIFHEDGDTANRWVTTRDVTANAGDGDYGVTAEAEDAGAIPLLAGVHVIATPVAGWSVVRTTKDAITGLPRETPEEFRRRRILELPGLGGSTPSAIRAAVSIIENEDGERPILAVEVLNNDTDFTSPEGLPPHSFCVIVWDGPSPGPDNDDLIAQAIYNDAPAGILSYGSEIGEAKTPEGKTVLINFQRVSQVALVISVDITTLNDYPGNQIAEETLVKLAASIQGPGAEAQWDAYANALRNLPGTKIETISLQGVPFTDAQVGPFEIFTLQSSDITII